MTDIDVVNFIFIILHYNCYLRYQSIMMIRSLGNILFKFQFCGCKGTAITAGYTAELS